MPIYEYKCKCPGQTYEVFSPIDEDTPQKQIFDNGNAFCPVCDEIYKRTYKLTFTKVMHEHWNVSTGSNISSMGQFRRELKRASEEATARTGIPHDFQEVDPHSKEFAPTDAGMQSTHDAKVKAGIIEPSKKVL